MAEATIEKFTNVHVAFYRPIKRSYYILKWNQIGLVWEKYNELHPIVTLHRSSTHAPAQCNFNIKKGRTGKYRIRVRADGYFLRIGTMVIPILQKIAGYIRTSCIGREYTAQEHELPTQDTYIQDEMLWDTRAPLAPAQSLYDIILQDNNLINSAPAPAPAPAIPFLPKRIASLIAEDIVKKGGLCAISLDPIILEQSAVTSCYHVFCADALEKWFLTNQLSTPCPVCRTTCVMTKMAMA